MANKLGNKTGGRTKGTRNKVKKSEVRKHIDQNISKFAYIDKLFSDIEDIKDPAKRAKARMDMLEYIVPKLKSIDKNVTINEDSNKIEIIYTVAPDMPKKDKKLVIKEEKTSK